MGGLYRPQNASVTIEGLSNIQKMSKARPSAGRGYYWTNGQRTGRPHYVQEDSPSITVRDATIAGLESMKERGKILGGSANVPAITSKRAWTGPERGATAARRGPYRDKRRLSKSERECD